MPSSDKATKKNLIEHGTESAVVAVEGLPKRVTFEQKHEGSER